MNTHNAVAFCSARESRQYQIEGAANIKAALMAGASPVLVSPTGSGKTFIAVMAAETYDRVLYVAHRQELIEQALAAFGNKVTAINTATVLRDGPPSAEVDLLVIDEAHRAAAKTYRELINKYATVPRFGLTATPIRLDGQGLGDAFSELIEVSSIGELVRLGHLVDYRAMVASPETLKELKHLKRLRKHHGDFARDQLAEIMDTPRLAGYAVNQYKKHALGRTSLFFAVSIEHSKKQAAAFSLAGIRAVHIDGNASEVNRRSALASLAAREIDMLCSVDLFIEGWDCPPVSCVIMGRPTLSVGLYLQSVGRGMRPHPESGKKDLIILDHAGNIDRHGYPEEKRAWYLEGERTLRAHQREEKRLQLEAAARMRGYASVAAELEERRLERESRLNSSYSTRDVATMLGIDGRDVRRLMKNNGINEAFN